MRRFALFVFALVAITACSVPKPETLNCGEDQSIFACQAKFSDGKSRGIVFVKVPMPDQEVLDSVTTRDDLGNQYCVTLYQNATATYAPGECGTVTSESASPAEPTATTVDPNAVPQGIACTEATSVYECRAVYSDGTIRRMTFLDAPLESAVRVDSDPHVDETGAVVCVTLYAAEVEATATFTDGAENC